MFYKRYNISKNKNDPWLKPYQAAQKQNNLPNYSMPPSIYNQPDPVGAPPPPQQFQNFVSQT